MSRHAFDFLTESFLWSAKERDTDFAGLTDEEISGALLKYREHVLSLPPVPASSLAVAMSARDLTVPPDALINRSVIYFDEVLIPDPVFHVSAQAHRRITLAGERSGVSRQDLARAARFMERLTPLVRLGRVRFVPTTKPHEGPERVPLLASDDHYASMVPEQLRAWFQSRVHIKKVLNAPDGRRLITSALPDSQTTSIQIDFGQRGPVQGFAFWHIAEQRGDDIRFVEQPPPDMATLAGWLEDSRNRAAGDYLQAVLTDIREARALSASFVTSCATTASLLETIVTPEAPAEASHRAALELRLPIVETASFDQLAELIERMPDAFGALRVELKEVAELLESIDDPDERKNEAKAAAARIGRTQVHEVERKIHEAKRKFRWEVPVTLAQLAAGGFGIASGNTGLALLSAGLATGSITLINAARKAVEHRALPGYFLWRLSRPQRGTPKL